METQSRVYPGTTLEPKKHTRTLKMDKKYDQKFVYFVDFHVRLN